MNKNTLLALTSALCLSTLLVGACGNKPAVAPEQGAGGKPGDTATSGKSEASQGKNITVSQQLPQIAAADRKIDLSKMQDTDTICSVDGVPITIGDYRRQFTTQAEQFRVQLGVNPAMQQQLLEAANSNHIALTDAEKKELIETAKKAFKSTGGALTKYLKDNHLTEKQFDDQVLQLGLCQKVAAIKIRQALLSDLIDRELLVNAGKQNGLGPAAQNRFLRFKKTPQYEEVIKSGLMTPEQAKDEAVKAALTQMMIEKIQEKSQASEKQIQDAYNEHKDSLKHGERVRLSQIFIADPKVDTAAGESVRNQIKKQNPKLSEKELDEQTKKTEAALKSKADNLLTKAMNGDDFAKLADENTDDFAVRAAKIGGDMGFQDKDKLQKDFADKVNSLKPGQVYPKLITSPLGFHIIKLTEKQSAGTVPLAEVKDALKQALSQRNAAESVINWLYDQRKNAKIELSPEFQKLASSPPASTAEPDKVD